MLHRLRPCAYLGVFLLLAGCSSDPVSQGFEFERPETAVAYDVEVTGAPSEEITELLEQSLLLYRRQEDGAQSLAFLRRRANGDIATTKKILTSYGYYEATVSAEVNEQEGSEALLARVEIEPGRPYILVRHGVTYTGFEPGPAPAIGPPDAFGSPLGQPALASDIVASEGALVAELQTLGFPYAEAGRRRAVIDPETAEMEIDSQIDSGQAYVYGGLSFEGAPNVDRDYLRTYLPWAEGDQYDIGQLRFYQRELMATGLFRSGRVEPPEEPPEGEALPITVTLEESLPRSVSAGVRFNTDTGPAVRFSFEHRNLFGANERLSAEATAGFEEQILGLRYRKPQYLRPGQDFTSSLELRRIEDDAFDELGATAQVGFERRLSPRWTVGAGILGEYSATEDEGDDQTAILGGLPFFAKYDSSDDLLDPTEGLRFRSNLTPYFGSFDNSFESFLLIDNVGSTYFDLLDDKRFILAGRARAATILADDVEDVPPALRLYSGGGGSVRGFEERFVGPLDSTGDPIGGLSALEAGLELRARVYGDFGVAVFTDAGAVSTDPLPSFEEELLVAVGGGLRYASPVGPIRLDVGVPVNGRPADESFQVYISIGQAF